MQRLAVLVLGVVGLLIGTNEVARHVLRIYTANIGYALTAQKWALLLEREEPLDWLVLGDSACNQGLDPELLERELGGEGLNLCTVASSLALDSAWMLDVAIERFGAPRRVALVHTFHIWERGFQEIALARIPLPWGFWNELEPTLDLDPGQTWRSWVMRSVPLWAENRSLARLFRQPGKTRRHYLVDERGFMSVLRPNPGSVERDAGKRLARLEVQRSFDPSELNLRALERIGSLADRYGFEVYVVNAPLYRGLAETEAFRRYFSEVARLLEGFAARHDSVHYVKSQHLFEKDEMQNADHLVTEAAERYTRSVADEIARLRASQVAGGSLPDRGA